MSNYATPNEGEGKDLPGHVERHLPGRGNRRVDNILHLIGKTPVVRVNRLFGRQVEIWMKLEQLNPGGSIKDRIALAMIEQAERDGTINHDTTIIEPTSGNTGIGLAMVAAVKGLKMIACMPESVSIERRRYLKALGAQVELTPREKGMKGSIARANELKEEIKNAYIPLQFENDCNPNVHRYITANEIIDDFSDGLDYVISGVGTGGHSTGCTETLKKHFPQIRSIVVEPSASAVLSGGTPGPHLIQGIGSGFFPAVLKRELFDEIVTVSNQEAFEMARRCAREEGIFVGISTGAVLAAVEKKLPDFREGSRVLLMAYDTGERYLSVPDLFPA